MSNICPLSFKNNTKQFILCMLFYGDFHLLLSITNFLSRTSKNHLVFLVTIKLGNDSYYFILSFFIYSSPQCSRRYNDDSIGDPFIAKLFLHDFFDNMYFSAWICAL